MWVNHHHHHLLQRIAINTFLNTLLDIPFLYSHFFCLQNRLLFKICTDFSRNEPIRTNCNGFISLVIVAIQAAVVLPRILVWYGSLVSCAGNGGSMLARSYSLTKWRKPALLIHTGSCDFFSCLWLYALLLLKWNP